MDIRYAVFFLSLVAVYFKAEASNDTIFISSEDTVFVICQETKGITDTSHAQTACFCDSSSNDGQSSSQPDDVSKLTLAVNIANNALTASAIIVGILTLFAAIFGFFEYKKLKDIKDNMENIQKKNYAIEKKQTLNNQYLQKVNQGILNNAYTIANVAGKQSIMSGNLIKDSMLRYYLIKLYLSKDPHEIDGCINYIKTKGTEKNIDDLQFIVNNDPDKYKSDKASEAIGYIRGRI